MAVINSTHRPEGPTNSPHQAVTSSTATSSLQVMEDTQEALKAANPVSYISHSISMLYLVRVSFSSHFGVYLYVLFGEFSPFDIKNL